MKHKVILFSELSQIPKFGNIGIIANYVFPYIYLQLHSRYKCEIRYQWIQEDCISRLQTSLAGMEPHGTGTKVKTTAGILEI